MTYRDTLIIGGTLFLALAGQSQSILFVSDATIGATDTNLDGQDIVVAGCTVTIDGSHSFSDLVLIENGQVTHSPIGTNSSGGLFLSISNDLIIETGSSIDVQGLGFGPGLGAGAGASVETTYSQFDFSFISGGGGAYGGNGGSSFGGAPGGGAYGPLTEPIVPGSGGGEGSGSGGAGGGLVNLTIGGTLVIDGEISANGADGVNLASGGGSGGAILISASSVFGSGSIKAAGGTAEGLDGGGGGGGRIALLFATNYFAGGISAAGGQGAVAGGAGTIDFRPANDRNQILDDNDGLAGTNTPLSVPSGSRLCISGGAIAYISAGIELSSMAIDSNSWLVAGPGSNTLILTVQSNVTIQTSGGINFNGAGGVSAPGLGGVYATNGLIFGGGGGYGGNGGGGYGAAGGQSFGNYLAPMAPGGSGGRGFGAVPFNLGGIGGGVMCLAFWAC